MLAKVPPKTTGSCTASCAACLLANEPISSNSFSALALITEVRQRTGLAIRRLLNAGLIAFRSFGMWNLKDPGPGPQGALQDCDSSDPQGEPSRVGVYAQSMREVRTFRACITAVLPISVMDHAWAFQPHSSHIIRKAESLLSSCISTFC